VRISSALLITASRNERTVRVGASVGTWLRSSARLEGSGVETPDGADVMGGGDSGVFALGVAVAALHMPKEHVPVPGQLAAMQLRARTWELAGSGMLSRARLSALRTSE
jgi:hypothetical protein